MTAGGETSSTSRGYRVTVPAPRPQWHAAFRGDPHAQAFHSPEWTDGVRAAGGFDDASRMYETPDGRVLVMPMARRSHLGGAVSTQASMPADWGVGGVISGDPIGPEDLSAICADLSRDRRVLRTFVRPAARTGPLWEKADLKGAKTTPRLCHVLDLEGGFETVWEQRFSKSARRYVRKAEKAGVVVERDETGARLPEYFALVEDSVERWAGQQHEPLMLSRWRARRRQSVEKMQTLAAAMQSRFCLYLAIWEGRPIAGTVVYRAAGTRATSGAMIKELAGPIGANYLLERTAIDDACAAGSTHYDLGESGNSPGLAMYKTRFGAEPQSYLSLVVERLPLTETDRLLRTAVKRVIGFREPSAPGTSGAPPADGEARPQ
ncbi:MAG: GNAT family N-acetyltransferase [Blastococcus sp.]